MYLSQRKLRQFDLGRRRRLSGRLKATIKAPLGIGELTVETTSLQDDLVKLDAVVTALDRSDRAPAWFTENVQPGQWVQFEAPMSYTTIGKAVVFLDIDDQSATYPSGGEVRLMLHGSAEHLVGSNPPPRTSVDELSTQASTQSVIDAEAFASVFNHFFDLIEYGSRQHINSVEEDRMTSFKNSIRAARSPSRAPDVERAPPPTTHGRLDGRLRSRYRCSPLGRGTPLDRVCHTPLRRARSPPPPDW